MWIIKCLCKLKLVDLFEFNTAINLRFSVTKTIPGVVFQALSRVQLTQMTAKPFRSAGPWRLSTFWRGKQFDWLGSLRPEWQKKRSRKFCGTCTKSSRMDQQVVFTVIHSFKRLPTYQMHIEVNTSYTYRDYSMKRRPRIIATLESKITEKPPLSSHRRRNHDAAFISIIYKFSKSECNIDP